MSQSSGSKTPSQTSLRQQRLNEIAEDNEEPLAPAAQVIAVSTPRAEPEKKDEPSALDGLPESAQRAKAMLAARRQASLQSEPVVEVQRSPPESQPVVEEARAPIASPTPEPAGTTTILPVTEPAVASPEHFPPRSSSIALDKDLPPPPLDDTPPVEERPSVTLPRYSHDVSLPPIDSDSDDDVRRPVPKEYNPIRYSNHLTAAESTSISQWSSEVTASTNTKQKRGPRPHEDSENRPKTAGISEDARNSRRAGLPSSVRVSQRVSAQPQRPGSQQSTRSVPARFVPSSNFQPPLPSTAVAAQPQRPPAYRTPSQASSYMAEAPSVTPEKMRLMKALQMRKRNQLLGQRAASAAPMPHDTPASSDSERSGLSDLSTTPSAANGVHRESASQVPELASINESEITTPTSAVTVSDKRSTNATSISATSDKVKSHDSLSSETNSSTTPRADEPSRSESRSEPVSTEVETKNALSGQQIEMQEHHKSAMRNLESRAEESRTSEEATADKPPTTSLQSPTAQDDQLEQTTSLTSQALSEESTATRKKKQFEGRIIIPKPRTEASDMSDTDSLLEELQNATVHEAKPMFVNRTPITPILARVPTRDYSRDLPSAGIREPKSRSASSGSAVSTPDKRRTGSRAGSARSVSTALPQWPPSSSEPMPALPKQRPNISAGISTRVKAFEGLSQREVSASSIKDTVPRSSSTLSNMFKRSSFLSHTNQEPKSPVKATSSPLASPQKSFFEKPEEQTAGRPVVQRAGTMPEVYSPITKGETVTVTARIVREQPKPQTAHGKGDANQMHWSPLIVEHETRDLVNPSSPRRDAHLAQLSPNTTQDRRRPSISSFRQDSLSPTEKRGHRMSFTSAHRKTTKSPSDASSMIEDKKGSKASRMLKRLSGFGKSRNKSSLTSPTQESLHHEPIQEDSETPDVMMRSVVDVGEVNVQFPETLLWKRRFLRVDNQGYLIFAPPTNDLSTRGKSRKFHLDELYQPTLPDLEREEMACSIILDLRIGGTISCACESKDAQRLILKSELITITKPYPLLIFYSAPGRSQRIQPALRLMIRYTCSLSILISSNCILRLYEF